MRLFLITLMLLVAACAESGETTTDEHTQGRSAGVILQYHHVDPKTPRVTSTTPEEFAAHMAYLNEQRFEVWPIEQFVKAISEGRPTPTRLAVITFDDAYDSIYANAFPILRAYGWPFTIFVATEPVVQRQSGYLSWDQLGEMKAAGATVANHTHTHSHLLRYKEGEDETGWLSRIEADIDKAQVLIDKHLGEAPRLFAYPYGEYDLRVASLIESLGYVGFGQQSGAAGSSSDFRVLPRFPFGGSYNDFETFKIKVDTLPLPITGSLVDPMIDKDLRPNLTLTLSDTYPHLQQLVCYGPGGPASLEQVSELTFVARSIADVPVGRSRYNCTMPSDTPGAQGDRFYWYSQLWIRKRPDGAWYPEP